MEPESHKYLFKYIIIGDSGCGKSCLLKRFTEDTFSNSHNMTIGVEFGSKIVNVDDVKIKIQAWDTAGQESFRSITRSYYRGSVGAVVVFDVTSRASFESARSWYNDCKEMTKTDVSILLVGNKIDLISHREVSSEEATEFAEECGMEYMETSAKTAQNVDAAFFSIAKKVLQKIQNGKIDPSTLGGSRGRGASQKGGAPSGTQSGNNSSSNGGGGASSSVNVSTNQQGGAATKKDEKKCDC